MFAVRVFMMTDSLLVQSSALCHSEGVVIHKSGLDLLSTAPLIGLQGRTSITRLSLLTCHC